MGSSKSAKEVAPTPTTIEIESTASEEAAATQRKRRGVQSTIITGALSPSSGGKTVLG